MTEVHLPDPAAHIYQSDLDRFKNAETWAHAYSVAVGNHKDRSVPLFTLSDVEDYANARVRSVVNARLRKDIAAVSTEELQAEIGALQRELIRRVCGDMVRGIELKLDAKGY